MNPYQTVASRLLPLAEDNCSLPQLKGEHFQLYSQPPSIFFRMLWRKPLTFLFGTSFIKINHQNKIDYSLRKLPYPPLVGKSHWSYSRVARQPSVPETPISSYVYTKMVLLGPECCGWYTFLLQHSSFLSKNTSFSSELVFF